VKTVVYARISDDRRDGVGVESQLQTCREWCAEEGWEPVTEYVDNDVSASVYSRKPRKAYQALLRAVEAGEVERVVCFAVDRLYRQPRELEVLIPLAERIPVLSKVGGALDLATPGGRLNARIQVTIAANESEVRSERIRLAQRRNRAQGDPHGGPRPFGWLALDGDQGRSWDPRRHDPQEAELIRKAARDILAGVTVTDIARGWTAAGVRQVRSVRGWHATTIRKLLTAPRNAGLMGSRGGIVGEGRWQPILDRETYERVCAELKRRAERFTFERAPRYVLTGVLVCGLCGTPLMHGRTRGTWTYRCKAGQGASGCGRCQIAAEPLERDIAEALFEYADGARLAEMALSATGSPAQAIVSELAQLEADAAETADLAARGRIRPKDFAAYSEATEERQRKLRASLAEVSGAATLEPYAGRPGVLRTAWPSLTTSQRRALILAGLGRLVVDSGRGGYDFARVRSAA